MPWDKVMGKFEAGKLHSGSKRGPHVTDRDQAVAIMLSEKRKAEGGKAEYAAEGRSTKDAARALARRGRRCCPKGR